MIAHPPIPPADRAYRYLPAELIFWLTCAGGLALDLWSKHWAWTNFFQGEDHPARKQVVIDGFLLLTAVKNDGALFGLGKGLVPFFIIASIGAIGVVLYLFAQSRKTQWGLHLATGLIMAGAIGNLYDRWHMGYVRDFIHFYKELNVAGRDIPLWVYIFNVADTMLVIGVGLLLIYWYVLPWVNRPRHPAPVVGAAALAPLGEPAYAPGMPAQADPVALPDPPAPDQALPSAPASLETQPPHHE